MTTPTPSSTITAPTAPEARCDACPHPLTAHDTIGRRFCQATIAGAITRGCSCRTP